MLKSIDLTLRPGTVTALCGGSGGGKSSIAGLVLRNYDALVGWGWRMGGSAVGRID